MSKTRPTAYFIVKCMTLENLQKCIESGEWACRDRLHPPHPRDLLAAALDIGQVILIFSVNNQHGWHGFCEVQVKSESLLTSGTKPKANVEASSVTEVTDFTKNVVSGGCSGKKTSDPLIDDNVQCANHMQTSVFEPTSNWYHFPVKWIIHFEAISKQTCLPFESTKHINLLDGNSVNKARNWQQVSGENGSELCQLISSYYSDLILKRQKKETEEAQKKESFFKHEESKLSTEVQNGGWSVIVQKVERELGKVHLACPFGSQRYNCSMPYSDNDIFLVYQARTRDILGLDSPKQTIKNSFQSDVDYTILEIQRYCELLVLGDPRCIETLFIDEETVLATASEEWRKLQDVREFLLTQKCFDRYMKEIHGTTGLKQIHNWRSKNEGVEEVPHKMNKLGYIVLRLLQNARDMALKNTLKVYRDAESIERLELISVRRGQYSCSSLISAIDNYLVEIEEHKDSIRQDTVEGKTKVQKWLLDCRITDLRQDPCIE